MLTQEQHEQDKAALLAFIHRAGGLLETIRDGFEHKTSVGPWVLMITDQDCLDRIDQWLRDYEGD